MNQHKKVIIYTLKTCPFCIKAKQLLHDKGVTFEEISVDNNPELRQEMAKKAGKTSVPQIWIGDFHVGGCDDLYIADSANKLDGLLSNTG